MEIQIWFKIQFYFHL